MTTEAPRHESKAMRRARVNLSSRLKSWHASAASKVVPDKVRASYTRQPGSGKKS